MQFQEDSAPAPVGGILVGQFQRTVHPPSDAMDPPRQILRLLQMRLARFDQVANLTPARHPGMFIQRLN